MGAWCHAITFRDFMKQNTRKAKNHPNSCLLTPSGYSLGDITLCSAADLLGRYTSQTWVFPSPMSGEDLSLDQV